MKSLGSQNEAFSGCGGKYFPAWAGNILPGPEQNPVVAPAGSALRVWLSQALEFWARPTRRPFNKYNSKWICFGLPSVQFGGARPRRIGPMRLQKNSVGANAVDSNHK